MSDLDKLDKEIGKHADRIYMRFAVTVIAASLVIIAAIMILAVNHTISINVHVSPF